MESTREIQRTLPKAAMARRLRANLAELSVHRPAVAASLNDALPTANASVIRGRWGMLTLATPSQNPFRRPDPMDLALYALRDVLLALERSEPVALCGIGDGYLLEALTSLDGGDVLVIEPDFANVLAAMTLHDFTGARGPVRLPRFRWLIGNGWGSQWARENFGTPSCFVRQHPQAAAIETILKEHSKEAIACG